MKIKSKVAVLMLLPNCNMSCDYCIIENKYQIFPESLYDAFLEQIKNKNYTHLILGGGEPTIWPGDLTQAAFKAKKQGLFVQIGTNGIHATKELFDCQSIDRWIVPLDSSIESVHNSVRHYKTSHYQHMQKTLSELKNRKKSTYLSTVITSQNASTLDSMVDFLNAYNENTSHLIAWNLYRLLPFGRGPQIHYNNLKIADSDFLKTVSFLKKRKRNFKIIVRDNMYGSENIDFYVFFQNRIQNLNKISF